jgi:hypothetical protein
MNKWKKLICDHPIAEPEMTTQVVIFTWYFVAWLGVPDILWSGVGEGGCNADWDEEIMDTNKDAPVPSLPLQIVYESP